MRHAAPALLGFAAVRLLCAVVLALWDPAEEKGVVRLLSRRWDSVWYASIAENGYERTVRLEDGGVHSDLAFFPLLPWLERGIGAVSPLSAGEAGLLVSAVASLAAAWGLFAIGDRLYGRRAGVLLAVLWAAVPVGIVQSMAYTESLFTAFAAWSLYALLTGRWLWAGALSAAAGLTRPAGLAVAAAVAVTAAVTLLSDRDVPWSAHRRMLLGVLLAPLGWLGYVVWVAGRTGEPLGYLDIQEQWGNGFDGGRAFASFVLDRLTGSAPLAGVGLIAGVALLIWVCVLCVRLRLPVPLLVYGAAMVVLALCAAGYFGSKPRLLLPAFPLLLPAAVALARARRGTVALVVGGAVAGAAVYGAIWLTGSGPP
ncbi:glycosyltransferase family 39 protein [Streptomyces sp. DSM 44938]|uniref:Glycosyltransferase family 39 protein n=1 Tax=Streptomyces litchfieldiae TaxID=3075543 RepID=A0ABU2MXG1_9ACTN|nr:glycosyltransferase family 39 protein [Streptomyces sp. DSM 44938]MDT0345518.1 glycosyltransferase family 39 protein [Streptomyces sp. DSM 44938]